MNIELEYMLLSAIGLFVIWQVALPLIRDRPVFPMFRSKGGTDRLKEARLRYDEALVRLEAAKIEAETTRLHLETAKMGEQTPIPETTIKEPNQ